MSKMSVNDIKSKLVSEKANTEATISAARLVEECAGAVCYYLGDMLKGMPPQGRPSRGRSSYVVDIEGLVPMHADLQYLRRWRKNVEQAQSYTIKAVITVVVSGFAGAVSLGVKVMLGK